MTWEELLSFIKKLDERFLKSQVEIFDCRDGNTITDILVIKDCSQDFVYDVDQPQLWIYHETIENGK